ncbi:3-carboxy-cis,cis-muconate lactonizing enzyme [Terriglobus roseus DSM 18391]|uniref:3-carboxy-cis,cis-muconate lactonizing enzyme n=1 Tax=Terriglobus roseus (strain DSM 18391 / NRRL B-41598 / KBS 63) TaxID=926566 RepID=I3ZGC8_TERRK|nr:beta-propeller fold lactonase family protein [Terriglobus roseus]AFL88296.1 3-carboxy-cis,cis-muconate lactonizing enzyme [Terriglobus roseus DSM 18391]AFL88637.1 3-carboxy-cis,cis-muconate lactonizing enzyme [Terriglobus roseus DSM 18391]
MQPNWTRRRFLQAAGLTIAAHGTNFTHALPLSHRPTHAYVAVENGLHVLRSAGDSWQPLQFVESFAPSAVLMNTRSGTLFVANARERFEGLPTASVESYRIDERSRTLNRIGTQRLSLAAVMPHAMALSPDGSLMVVAAAAGLYNMLPVTRDGAIGEVTAVRKELRLDAAGATHMFFASDKKLQVQDASGTRLYRCDLNGMALLDASPSTQPLPSGTSPLVTGQRSVAFARFA